MFLISFHILIIIAICLLVIRLVSCVKIEDLSKRLDTINDESLNRLNMIRYFTIFKSVNFIFKTISNSSILLYKFRVDRDKVDLDFAMHIRYKKGKILPSFMKTDEEEIVLESFKNVKKPNKKFIKGDFMMIDDIKLIEGCYPYTYKILKKNLIKSYCTQILFKNNIPYGIMILTFKKQKTLKDYEISFVRRVSKIISQLI